jgi:predicted DNA-binding transcriptional regulator AlpA
MNTYDDDDLAFWRYSDLVERRIVSGRSDLHRKQEQDGFPRPVKLTKGRGAIALFQRSKVNAWLRQRLSDAS